MSLLEYTAATLGFVCVWLTVRQHVGCWPTGLASVLLYIAIFFDAKLYSDMLLQVVYVFLQIYGWHAWLRGGPQSSPLAVSRLAPRDVFPWSFACIAGTAALGSLMHRYTDASFPFIDAFVTVASLIAQWLMARKILESWLVWIVVDVVSIGLFGAKHLVPTAVLYAVFLLLATHGYFAWRRTLPAPAAA